MRIKNPYVMVKKKETDDEDSDYSIFITDGSTDYKDSRLKAVVSAHPDKDEWTDTLEVVCWYMARELSMVRQGSQAMSEFIGLLKAKNIDYKIVDNSIFVLGRLDLGDSKIEKLPENLTVRSDLYLSYSKIRELPDNLTVGGRLYLGHSNIEKLPENLTVGRDLYLTPSLIRGSLPKSLKVNRQIYR